MNRFRLVSLGLRVVMTSLVLTFLLGQIAQAQTSSKQGKPRAKDKPARDFRPRSVVRPFRAIRDAKFINVEDVTDQVAANELILGVVVDGDARAYPINMLTGPSREIINDTLGGKAIAATW